MYVSDFGHKRNFLVNVPKFNYISEFFPEKIVGSTLCSNLNFVDFNKYTSKYTSNVLSFLRRLDSTVASRN